VTGESSSLCLNTVVSGACGRAVTGCRPLLPLRAEADKPHDGAPPTSSAQPTRLGAQGAAEQPGHGGARDEGRLR
jgi:hypothetical protein